MLKQAANIYCVELALLPQLRGIHGAVPEDHIKY
jgi:hypothetical protein